MSVFLAGNFIHDLIGIELVEDIMHNRLLSDDADDPANDAAVAPLLRPRRCEVASGHEPRLAGESSHSLRNPPWQDREFLRK